MIRKNLVKSLAAGGAIFLAAFSHFANAEDSAGGWYVELEYSDLEYNVDGDGVDLSGIGLVGGYNIIEHLAVEVIAGIGAGDENYYGATVELDRYFGLVLKPNVDINERANVYLELGYVDIQLEASGGGITLRDSSDEFMYGVGAQINFTDAIYATFGYQDVDDADGFKLGVGYHF